LCSDLVSCKSSSRDLDHCTNFVLKVASCSSDLSVSCLNNEFLHVFQLFDITNKRDHDLRLNFPARMSFLYVDSRADNSLCLHLCDLRICYSQTASTVTHHRVELMEAVDDLFDPLNGFALSLCQLLDVLFLCRNELMERRVKETDRYRVAFQSLVQLLEVALLIRKDLLKSFLSLFLCLSTDHLTECVNSSLAEEH